MTQLDSSSGAAGEQQLLRRIGRGDQAAFLQVYGRHQAAVFRYARHMTGDAEIAADAVQETFLALLRQAGSLDTGRGALLAWLFAVARKQVLRHLAAAGRHVSLGEDAETAPAAGDFVVDLEREQLAEMLRGAVASLPFLYREAVVLCDMQGLSYEDAAVAMECPVGTVRSRLHRGRALVAEKLEPIVKGTR